MVDKKEKEPVFEKGDLINAAPAVFGVAPEVMAGALHSVKKPITESEAKERLEKFLTREVSN